MTAVYRLVYGFVHFFLIVFMIHKTSGEPCFDADRNITQYCHVNASCVSFNNTASCICLTGLTGNGTHCVSNEKCTNIKCPANSSCKETGGSHTCACLDGYTWNGTACNDKNECQIGESKCHRNALCQNNAGSYSCHCASGFKGNGTFCEDVDECFNGTNPCSNGTCINTIGSFNCSCRAGFSGDLDNCTNVDECALDNTCSSNATCEDTHGSFLCSCKSGFTGNGTFCEDIDECKNFSICGKNEFCENIMGSYSCRCRTGFERNTIADCVDIDECENGTHSCSDFSACINTQGAYNCSCKIGFSGNGSHCTEIDMCQSKNKFCHPNSTCATANATRHCTCMPGFTGNGTYCTYIDECKQNHACNINAECIDNEGSYNCHCKDGFSGNGTHCYDVDECRSISGACNSFDACSNTIGSFRCLNHCRRSLCPDSSFCRNTIERHQCTCIDGLYMSNGLCKKAKMIFRIDELSLKQEYVPNYGSRRSSAFAILATGLESRLLKVYKTTEIATGLDSVQVFSLRKGSIVISYYLLYSERTRYSVEQVAAIASNHTLFLELNPDESKKSVARATNLCEIGSHDCEKRAICIASNSEYGYECKCKQRYELRNGKCRKKRTYAEIIIPTVVGGLLFIFFAFLLIALLCKRRRVRKAEREELQRYEVHIEKIHMENGRDNITMQMRDISAESTWKRAEQS